MASGRQIELVQDSFALVLPHTEPAAAFFYDRLFVLAPGTRQLFHGDMSDQGRKLFQTLAIVVDALHRIDDVLPTAEALAVRHVGYGVREEHYQLVGAALIDTLRHGLGDAFSVEVEAAWVAAYDPLSRHMIAAANEAARQDVAA